MYKVYISVNHSFVFCLLRFDIADFALKCKELAEV